MPITKKRCANRGEVYSPLREYKKEVLAERQQDNTTCDTIRLSARSVKSGRVQTAPAETTHNHDDAPRHSTTPLRTTRTLGRYVSRIRAMDRTKGSKRRQLSHLRVTGKETMSASTHVDIQKTHFTYHIVKNRLRKERASGFVK